VTRAALGALVAVSLAAPTRAHADPPTFSSPADTGGKYETVVHARPRREAGQSVVLTARDLERRGVDNLAEALALIPEVSLREGGRGTVQLDLRGAKQRSVMILIDGVPVDEPYFGSFDLASIPITDIVEIRVTLSPASPLEGPGGDGGIVEVQTLHATGGRRINGRLEVSSTPSVQAAVTGRGDVTRWLSLRASGGGRYGVEHYPVVNADGTPGSFDDKTDGAHGALRLEHVARWGSVTGDVWGEHRSYYIPPSDVAGTAVQHVLAEDAVRAVLGAEILPRGWRIALGGYTDVLSRSTDYFADYAQTVKNSHEGLWTNRSGGAVHVDRALGRYVQLSSRLSFDTEIAIDRLTSYTPQQPAMTQSTSANSTLAEWAVGAQLKWNWLRIDGAVGVAAPISSRNTPWPEAKLTVSFALSPLVQLRLIGARKGRIPTLRELNAPNEQGNPALNPEQNTYAEAALVARPHRLLNIRASGYFRYTQGMIRLTSPGGGPGMMPGGGGCPVANVPPGTPCPVHFANLDDIYTRGFDLGFDVARDRIIGGGATYLFADAYMPSNDPRVDPSTRVEPIMNFPHHRVDAWLASNWRNQAGGLLRARYVSSRLDQGVPLDAYAVVDLSAWWRVRREFRVTARCDNLLDTRFQVRSGVASLGRVVELILDGTWE